MDQPAEQTVEVAIRSYGYGPRVLSVSEVVRQVASVFPDEDRDLIAHRVRKARRMQNSDDHSADQTERRKTQSQRMTMG